MQALALRNATANEVKNAQTAKDLRAKGVNLYEWAPEELGQVSATPCRKAGPSSPRRRKPKPCSTSHINVPERTRRHEVADIR